MLAYAREARHLVAGKSREDLHRDRLLQLAQTRLVEVVERDGYAARDADWIPATRPTCSGDALFTCVQD